MASRRFVADYDSDASNDNHSEEDSLNLGDSTRSLLTPLYASDYESKSDGEQSWRKDSNDSPDFDAQLSDPRKCSTPKSDIKRGQLDKTYNTGKKPIPWEEWVVRKTLESLEINKEKRLQNKLARSEEKKKEAVRLEKLKEAEVKRGEWLEQKKYEVQKKRKEASAQRKYAMLKNKQMKEISESRSKEKYSEWYKKKEEEEKQRRDIAREKEEKLKSRMLERKSLSDVSYANWLKANNKKRPDSSKGKQRSGSRGSGQIPVFGLVTPQYVNPKPWVSTCNMIDYEACFDGRPMPFESPPLLWKDYHMRVQYDTEHRSPKSKKYTKPRLVKHNCLNIT